MKFRAKRSGIFRNWKITNKGITSFVQKLNSFKKSLLVSYYHHNVDCRKRKKIAYSFSFVGIQTELWLLTSLHHHGSGSVLTTQEVSASKAQPFYQQVHGGFHRQPQVMWLLLICWCLSLSLCSLAQVSQVLSVPPPSAALSQ